MLWGGHTGGLEIRTLTGGVAVLRGRFPYQVETVLHDGGRTGQARKEQIAARAFAARIEAGSEIHFLAGHDPEKPIASRSAGSFTVNDSDDALTFEARISPEMRAVSWIADLMGAVENGLIRGISPGFRLANIEGAETIKSQNGAILRTVNAADLIEISAVTRAAYPQAQLEARSWQTNDVSINRQALARSIKQWRL